MCPLNYGTDGIRSRDYKVWFNYIDDTKYVDAIGYLDDFFTHYDAGSLEDAYDDLVLLKDKMYHVGEMRADSIELMCDDGDSIEGNVLGKIIMSKSCKFNAELINSTPDNISEILKADGKECIIFLEENNNRRMVFFDPVYLYGQELIFLCNKSLILAGGTDGVGCNFSFSEKITGSGIPLVTMNTEREVASVADFRKILDLPYEDEVDVITNLASVAGSGDNETDLTWTKVTGDDRFDGVRFQVAAAKTFATIETTIDIVVPPDEAYTATLLYATYNNHYIRACYTRNGLQISDWSDSDQLAIKEPE